MGRHYNSSLNTILAPGCCNRNQLWWLIMAPQGGWHIGWIPFAFENHLRSLNLNSMILQAHLSLGFPHQALWLIVNVTSLDWSPDWSLEKHLDTAYDIVRQAGKILLISDNHHSHGIVYVFVDIVSIFATKACVNEFCRDGSAKFNNWSTIFRYKKWNHESIDSTHS